MAKPKTRTGFYDKLRPYTFNKPLVVAFALLAVVTGFAYVASTYAYSKIYSCDFHTVRYGSTGNCVRELQWHLDQDDQNGRVKWPHECGGYPYQLTVDGVFGSKTLADVKDFQRYHGATVDGVVGPQTWGKIKYYRPNGSHLRCGYTNFNG